jgi:hypothetical protein
LDWKKKSASVLSLHVGQSTIDLAVTSHPSSTNNEELILPLPSVPIKCEYREQQKQLQPSVLKELVSVVNKFEVCGIVVSWPVQKEGWCGAACGRVLHLLDNIARQEDIVSPSRPVALWDGHHYHSHDDEWGRSAIYSHISEHKKDIHVASQEQYRDEGSLAAEIAHDYLRHHWPDLYSEDYSPEHWSSSGGTKKTMSSSSSSTAAAKKDSSPKKSVDFSWLDSYEDTATYSKALS